MPGVMHSAFHDMEGLFHDAKVSFHDVEGRFHVENLQKQRILFIFAPYRLGLCNVKAGILHRGVPSESIRHTERSPTTR